MFVSQSGKFPIMNNLTSYPLWLNKLSWRPNLVVPGKLRNTGHNMDLYQGLE